MGVGSLRGRRCGRTRCRGRVGERRAAFRARRACRAPPRRGCGAHRRAGNRVVAVRRCAVRSDAVRICGRPEAGDKVRVTQDLTVGSSSPRCGTASGALGTSTILQAVVAEDPGAMSRPARPSGRPDGPPASASNGLTRYPAAYLALDATILNGTPHRRAGLGGALREGDGQRADDAPPERLGRRDRYA